jgi:hypothetical protein
MDRTQRRIIPLPRRDADLISQAMTLGAVLENPKRLKQMAPNDFADWQIREVFAEMQRKDAVALQRWLENLGVQWDGTGKAIDAVISHTQATGQRAAVRRLTDRMRRHGFASVNAMQEYLKKLTGQSDEA